MNYSAVKVSGRFAVEADPEEAIWSNGDGPPRQFVPNWVEMTSTIGGHMIIVRGPVLSPKGMLQKTRASACWKLGEDMPLPIWRMATSFFDRSSGMFA